MRVLFLGNSPNSILPLLALCRSEHHVVGVVCPVGKPPTEPLRRVRQRLSRAVNAGLARLPLLSLRLATRNVERALTAITTRHGVPLLLPASIHDPLLRRSLRELDADVVVMWGFNQILKAPLLAALPPVINVHPSLLPHYRGPAPFFWTLAHGEREGGVTLHYVTPGIDAGPIVNQRAFEIDPHCDAGGLRRLTGTLGTKLLLDTLARISDHPPRDQQGEGSYQGVVTPADLIAPLWRGQKAVYDRARAASPDHELRLFVPNEWWQRGYRGQVTSYAEPAPGLIELRMRSAVPEIGSAYLAGVVKRVGRSLLAYCGDGAVRFSDVRASSPTAR